MRWARGSGKVSASTATTPLSEQTSGLMASARRGSRGARWRRLQHIAVVGGVNLSWKINWRRRPANRGSGDRRE
jgi:hypothetical protein